MIGLLAIVVYGVAGAITAPWLYGRMPGYHNVAGGRREVINGAWLLGIALVWWLVLMLDALGGAWEAYLRYQASRPGKGGDPWATDEPPF